MRTPAAILWRVTDTAFVGVTSGPGREPTPGAALLEFVTERREDVALWHARIERDGWTTDGPPRPAGLPGVTCFFATDPNGYSIEFLHFAERALLASDAR
jgi:hypothetical protein